MTDIPWHELRQEHQSKALLIKLTWIMLSGFCLLFVMAMRSEYSVRSAYLLAKIGTNLWIFAGLVLIAAGNLWLKDEFIAKRVRRALWGATIVWLAIAAISFFLNGSRMAIFDIAFAAVAFFAFIPRLLKGWSENQKAIQQLAVADGYIWLLSATSLLLAASFWAYREALLSGITAALLSPLAILTGYFCLMAPKNLGHQNADDPKADNTVNAQSTIASGSHRAPLDYVVTRTNFLARVAIVYYVISLIGTMKFLKDTLVGPTIAVVLLGFAAALMATKISILPKFEDRLRVFSSAMGTQFIYPSQIDVDDQLFAELREQTDRFEASSRTAKR